MMKVHPSKEIIGTKSNILRGKRIVLGICGSVAAIKCPEIAREIMRHGGEVFTVMSPAAKKIIHPYLMEWATGNPVITELTGKIEHVQLCGQTKSRADLLLIAPSTANTISKIANGIDDTPVTTTATTALGTGIPIMIVPAMHRTMYDNPIVKANIERLKRIGIEFIGPRIEEGKAKIANVEEIIEAIITKFTVKDMKKRRVLVNAGPTREYLDQTKYLTTPSSGKMGTAIAKECKARGAKVTLIMGPTEIKAPLNIETRKITTCHEMMNEIIEILKKEKFDYIFLAAAPLDYRFEETYQGKIDSERREYTIKLTQNPKIAKKIREYAMNAVIVGFKAEVSKEELIERAYRRLKEYRLDLIVGNDISREDIGFQSDYNEVIIIDEEKNIKRIPKMSKREIAQKIVNEALKIKK